MSLHAIPNNTVSRRRFLEALASTSLVGGVMQPLAGQGSPCDSRDTVVLVNQVGFLPPAVKKVVLQDSQLHAQELVGFDVLRGTSSVFSGTLKKTGELWGRHYWVGDCSALTAEGKYQVRASVEGKACYSFPFSIGPRVHDEALYLASRFFYYQRCGCKVDGWHEACHLDDAFIPDENRHVNAVGGWHDAGDYNKFGGDAFTTYALVTTYERSTYLTVSSREDILSEAIWGAQYLLRMVCSTGGLYCHVREIDFHGPRHAVDPARDTDNVSGTRDDRLVCGVCEGHSTSKYAAAALAKLARLVAKSHPQLSRDCRAAAEALMRLHPDDMNVYCYAAHLLADLELYALSGNSDYAGDAGHVVTAMTDSLSETRPIAWAEITQAGMPYAALIAWLATLGQEMRDVRVSLVRDTLAQYVAHLRQVSTDPFSIARFVFSDKGEQQSSWFMPTKLERYAKWPGHPPYYQGPLHYVHVGLNSYYASLAYSLLLYARATEDRGPADIAEQYLSWILGMNPMNVCMVQGIGSKNPSRLYTNMSLIPGHQDGCIPGAVPNGISRPIAITEGSNGGADDTPFFDFLPHQQPKYPRRAPYECSEVWLPNNANFILALSELIGRQKAP